jgi:small subunit ribosomal protein S6
MNNYELLYIVANQYTEEEAKNIQAKVNSMIEKNSGILGYQENMGKKKLAYPIDHVAHGYYFLAEFELEDGTKLKDISENLRLDKEILRAQIVTKKEKTTEAELKKQKALRERNSTEEKETAKPATEKPERTKKADMKDLDEKLDEILKTDDLV